MEPTPAHPQAGQRASEEVAEEVTDDVARAFLASLGHARHETWPYDYWLLENVLPAGVCEAIVALPLAPPENLIFDGTRASNNSYRVFFTAENQARFEVCRRLVLGFRNRAVLAAIEDATGTDLADGHLRIEYCQDTAGFWLEPHTDIAVKKFTLLVYLSDDPRLANAGTNILTGPPDHEFVTAAPYGLNRGVLFIPGDTTWHGVGHHRIQSLRRSIIVNIVTSDWRDRWQLA